MREFEAKDFEEGLRTGLRAFKGNSVNRQSLVRAFNVLADESGLIPFEPLTSRATSGWFFSGNTVLLHLSTSGILSSVNIASWTFTTVYTFPSNSASRFEVFDADSFMFISNGNGEYCSRTYLGTFRAELPNSSSDYSYTSPTLVFPEFTTITNFRGQPVCGNITPGTAMVTYTGTYKWDDCDSNTVVWGDIGKFNFRPDQGNVAGKRRVSCRGSVLKVMELGNAVIAYSTGGVASFNPVSGAATTFGYKGLQASAALSVHAIAGSSDIQIYISRQKEVWKIGKDLLPKVLGYQEWVTELTESEIQVSYDHDLNRFYISDLSRCFVLTAFGMTECYQNVRSVVNIEGSAIGVITADASPDTSFDTLTDTIDYKQRSLKHLEFLEFGVRGGADLMGYVDWRNGQGAFNTSPDKACNNLGICRIGVTAGEFRLGLKASSYEDVYLSYIKQRIKLIDKRSIRGLFNAN